MPGLRNKNCYRVVVATTVGPYHKTKGLEGQDRFACQKKGQRIVGVVSDGAGSAKYGKIGAKTICQRLCDILLRADMKDIRQGIVDGIESVRDELALHRFNKLKNENGLIDFAATVVGVVYEKNKGVFFHIGDGAGIAMGQNACVISEPENGIFTSETFFFTMDDWKDSLRFTPFKEANSIFLMTDGVTGFALKKNMRALEKGFIEPINAFLKNENNTKKASRALKNTLETPKASSLNGDDKTLMWIGLK